MLSNISLQSLFFLLPLSTVLADPFTTLSSRTSGLVVDSRSCEPYKAVLVKAIAAARDYVSNVILATEHPTSDPYFYFFKPASNVTVREAFQRMDAALHGEGTVIPFRCEEVYEPFSYVCTGYRTKRPLAWTVANTSDPHINFCPWAFRTLEPFPNPCFIAPDPYFLNARERWPQVNNRWLERNTLADVIVHELSHLPSIIGNERGATDRDQSFDVYSTHILAHAEDVRIMDGDLYVNETDNAINWEFMSKEAWRRAEARKNRGEARTRMCEDIKKGNFEYLKKDELKRLRRLKIVAQEGP
jgi:hypothetical protein